jgi:hypothetical protein
MIKGSNYPFAFDLITGRHGFKKRHRVKLSDEEKKALKAVEDRLKKRTSAKRSSAAIKAEKPCARLAAATMSAPRRLHGYALKGVLL